MSRHDTFLATRGLAFFGEVTATITHELKNVLATVSETAGLLGDLLEESDELDVEELRSCGRTIIEEIRRGFDVVASLNRFAHSTDEPAEAATLQEIVELVVRVAGSLSFSRKLTVIPHTDGDEARITDSPVVLQYLLYRAMVIAFRSVDVNDELTIVTGSDRKGEHIVLSGLGAGVADSPELEQLHAAAHQLGVEVQTDARQGTLTLRLPPTMSGDPEAGHDPKGEQA
jgi:C4-dicarboxylate-specific signal transduction histidine kinase